MNEKSDQPSTSRRALLIAGGTAAVGVAAVVAAPVAEAANGSAMICGKGNSATSSTVLSINSAGTGFSAQNTGPAASFISETGTGFVGSTLSANANGLVAVNKGTTTGSGAALVASGQKNTGAVAQTASGDYGLVALHTATTGHLDSGAVYADGGVRDGVFSQTSGNASDFSGVSGFHWNGGAGVFGQGGIGVQGWSNTSTGAALYGTADGAGVAGLYITTSNGADARDVTGKSVFSGDIVVTGTIYCNNPIAPIPAKAAGLAASKIQRRAGRTASKLRPRP